MAGLINTGIWGFLTSARLTGKKILNAAGEEIDDWTSTFVSGLSGWMIDKLGNAEFKSVFVRDKFVTNEFVHNRIRVTEDEEIISSSIKIASYIDNEDGTYTVFPDLREGDYNPLAEDDLLIGYYHAKGNTGTIYSIQKFTAISGPSKADQSILLEPETDSIPYRHMIVVRVGNISDEDRQSFIRISSRTNCQYFYDGIDSWAAYDNPEHIKLTLGHVDIGLIPAWARNAVSGIKRWFGLIADGVIIRGTFILHNDKTIEDELNNRETRIRGDFEIREDGITGKWQEVIDYAKEVETEVETATNAINKTKEEATSSIELTAKDFALAFTQFVDEKTIEATGEINSVTKSSKSELNLTAKGLITKFEESVTDAEGDIIKEISTQVTQNAKEWKVEVMGTDKDGNPNTVLSAINADESGIKIKGEKVQIDGDLLVKAIMASGINIDDVFVVAVEDGKAKVSIKGDGIFTGAIKTPFNVFGSVGEIVMSPEGTTGHNFVYTAKSENDNRFSISNIDDEKFNGATLRVYVDGDPGEYLEICSPYKEPSVFILPGDRSDGVTRDFDIIKIKVGGYLELQGLRRRNNEDGAKLSWTYWIIKNYDSTCMELLNWV